MSLRGPSTISTPARGEHRPRVAGAEGRQRGHAGGHAAGDAAERQVAVDAQARHQILGPRVSSATSLTAARNSLTRAASSVRPAACRWPPKRIEQRRAALERPEHVEVRDAAARAVRHAVFDRQHDGRPVERVHELRGDDADDAAVPALAGDHEDGARADVGIRLDDLPGGGEDRGFLFLPPHVFAVELQRQRARFVRQRLVAGEQQPRGDVRRAHAPCRIHAAAPA